MEIKSIQYESDTCGRCGGKGTYPSSCYNGICLGCGGKGTRLTRRGKAAQKRVNEWKKEHCKRNAHELVKGDQIWHLVRPDCFGGSSIYAWIVFTGEIGSEPSSWRVNQDGSRGAASYPVVFECKGKNAQFPRVSYSVELETHEFQIRPVGELFQELAQFAKRFNGVELIEA